MSGGAASTFLGSWPTTRPSMPQGWPPAAMAAALAHAGTDGCRVDAVRIRGRLRDVFVAYDGGGRVFVHVVIQPYPRNATRLHALLPVGGRLFADCNGRELVRYLRGASEVELRGADLRVHGGGVPLEHPPTHFELVHPWIAQVWPAEPSPAAPSGAATTTEPPASAGRAAA